MKDEKTPADKKSVLLYEKLLNIQQRLEAPKDQYNEFAKFKYRSAEGILNAVKPLLKEYGLVLLLSDRIINAGDRYYVACTATLTNGLTSDPIRVQGYAREQEVKKGMDTSQITGSASSYARKYALNGLFAIDDIKDADSMNNTREAPAPQTTSKSCDLCGTQGKYHKKGCPNT